MASAAQWDEAFLKQRDDEARETAFDQQCDADWEQARRQLKREHSDVHRGFASCPSAKCRRARRCMGDDAVCLAQLRMRLPPHVELDLVEEIYAEIQTARREAAEAAEAELEQAMVGRDG
jgi:hypothetical protein